MSTTRKRPGRAAVEAAIRGTDGNLSKAAAQLGCSRPTLYTWIYQLGLQRMAGVRLEPDAELVPVSDIPITVTVRVPEALWRWVRKHAIDTDRTASDTVCEGIELLRAVVREP